MDDEGLRDCCWLEGGLLLGWARSGEALANDLQDVDFGVLDVDFTKVLAAVPALEAAGFPLLHVVHHHRSGEAVSAHFRWHGIQIDFVKAVPKGDALLYQGVHSAPVMVSYERPVGRLALFELFGKRWLKPDDHERALAAQYGDWRNNWRKDWCAPRDSPCVVAVEVWRDSTPEEPPSHRDPQVGRG